MARMTRSGRAREQVDGIMRGSSNGARNRALWIIAGTMLAMSACKTDGKDKAQPELGSEVSAKNAALPQELAATTKPVEPKVPEALPGLSGPHFAAFDLLVNRPLAHRMELHEGKRRVAIDASSTDWLRYTNGNYPSDWALDLEVDERGNLVCSAPWGKFYVLIAIAHVLFAIFIWGRFISLPRMF